MLRRLIAGIGGLALATTLSQFPEYAQQYTQRLGGAVDEDHQQLAVLEDEVNKTVVSIDRLLNELSEDVSRQTAYVGNERANLTTLSLAIKNGELLGPSLANRAFANAAPLSSSPPQAATATDRNSQFTKTGLPGVVPTWRRAEIAAIVPW